MHLIRRLLFPQGRTLCLVPVLVLLCSCATRNSVSSSNHGRLVSHGETNSVRKVNIRKAPALGELAKHARQYGNEMYPKICALLADETARPPKQFDVVFRPLKSGNMGEAHLEARRLYINSDYCTNDLAGLEKFDKVFIHEMAHLAQQYKGKTRLFWYSTPPPYAYWGEGISDYIFYKLVSTNGWACPECSIRYPHYTSGYTCSGAFLLYLDARFGTNIVRQLNAAMRQYTYTDEFFRKATGTSLDELWADFQKTSAFKPGAREAFQLREALGYVNGVPPGNALARFHKFVGQQANPFTKRALQSASLSGKPVKDIQSLMILYLYLTQPGGPPEQFLFNLREQDQLPGVAWGEKGWISKFLTYEEMEDRTYPITRTLVCGKKGDSSQYHYTVVRASETNDWKMEKAWRSAPDGQVIEEYAVP